MSYQPHNLPFKPGNEIVELGGGDTPIIVNFPALKTVNVDTRKLPGVDIVRNLEGDFSDIGPFDGLFASYLAEHISWPNIARFFEQCFKILKEDTFAVFIVPDTYKQVQKIMEKSAEEIDLGDSCLLFGGQDYGDNSHKVLFSRPLITRLLKEGGFSEVEIVDHPNLECQDMIVTAHKGKEATPLEEVAPKARSILVGAVADTDTKINFGSFTVTFGDAWINADLRGDIQQLVEAKGHLFEFCDVTKPVRWTDNSVSLITAHHLIEHLSREEGAFFLRECFRILKPEGVIRLSTPDLDVFTHHHLNKNFKATYKAELEALNAEDNADAFFRLAFKGHKTIYNYPALNTKLESAGFKEVKKMPYGASRSTAIMTETEDSFPDHSFYIEGVKRGEMGGLEMVEREGIKIVYRGNDGKETPDLSILNDLFDRAAYAEEVLTLPQNSVVVDVGAHIGVYSLIVKSRRPDLRVYAVEPLPENVELLRRNIAENGMDIKVFPVAISDVDGEKTMWVHDFNQGANTLSEEAMKYQAIEFHTEIKVPCITLASLLERINEDRIDLLKLDVQGEEYPLIDYLCSHPEVRERIKSIDVEFHTLGDKYATAVSKATKLQVECNYLMTQQGKDTAFFYPQSSAQTAKPVVQEVQQVQGYKAYLQGDTAKGESSDPLREATDQYIDGGSPAKEVVPEVSIVMTTVNALSFMDSVNSVKEKTEVDYELIIVCDVPADEKRKQLEKMEADGAKVIINEERVGVGVAQNMGVRASTGAYILHIHDDQIVRTMGWLKPMVAALKTHPEFGYVVPLIIRPTEKYCKFGDLAESSLLTRELIEKVGGWDESDLFRRLAGDGDYFIRIKRAGYRPHGIVDTIVVHLLGETIKGELERIDVVDNMQELFDRYGEEEVLIDRRLLPVYHGEEMLPKW